MFEPAKKPTTAAPAKEPSPRPPTITELAMRQPKKFSNLGMRAAKPRKVRTF